MIKLILLGIFLYTMPAHSITCVKDYGGENSCVNNQDTAGDCAILGYSTENVKDCAQYLRCPFNSDYKICVSGATSSSIDCATLGFTQDDKSTWCAPDKIIKCPTNESLTLCNGVNTEVMDCASLGFTSSDKTETCPAEKIVTCPTDSSLTICTEPGAKPINCAELGFTQDDKSEICLAEKIIKCPTDETYTLCSEPNDKPLDCAAIGFTTSDKSAWCGNIVQCPNDTTFTMCSRPKGCAIGDVFYADGSCSSVDMYDESKIAIGVVYALSSGKGGMPYSTAVSESQDFASLHGRVISLEYLTVDKTLYVFDPTNPFNNSYSYIPFGLYNTNINVKHYGIVGGSLATGYFSEADMYDGKQNTAVISTTEPAFASCVGTNAINYTKGTADYNKSCTPTAALAAISFYPPNVDSSNALAGAGNWYIPSMGELSLLYGFDANSATSSFGTDGNTGTTIKIVNNTLKTLSSKGLTVDTLATQNHWSSTIVSKYDTWAVNLNNGSRVYSVERSSKIWLRPSLEF